MSQLNSLTGASAPRAPLAPPVAADAHGAAALLEQMAELAPQPETLTTKLAAIGLLDAVSKGGQAEGREDGPQAQQRLEEAELETVAADGDPVGD